MKVKLFNDTNRTIGAVAKTTKCNGYRCEEVILSDRTAETTANITLKLACLVHKILHTGHTPYLTELLQYLKPAVQHPTRSSASHLLSVPRHNLSCGARAFRVAAPKIWNSIPLHIRQSQTYSSFRRHLKTYYFRSAHLAPYSGPCSAP